MTGDATGFDLLAGPVQRWIWKQGWNELRDVQHIAIPHVLAANRDVVIASATASGKTEAAFLPIASRLDATNPDGLGVLYVSPLKALINDQHPRLEVLFESIGLPATAWHGDASPTLKKKLIEKPQGVLLITPESLEAMFVNRGTKVGVLFGSLEYVVVDELHAFIGSERGRQLQSLLHRVELAARRRIPRIALSATLGDLGLACEFLRPSHGSDTVIVESTTARHDVQLQIKGYLEDVEPDIENHDDDLLNVRPAWDHIYSVVRGGTHLAFANSRTRVEQLTDYLRRTAEQERLPDEFWAHHGNLSKEMRSDAEAALRSSRPATVVATTTLELGIDVGAVDTIVQVGVPPSVASMRQRLGRSGRRAEDSSVLRTYIEERKVDASTPPGDQIRGQLFQSVAMVELLIRRWIEPPVSGALHLSTLIQQVMSMIAQFGGLDAHQAWEALCHDGPFHSVSTPMFANLLRDLAAHDLITQTHDGQIVLGLEGERLVNHYDFYAAFTSRDEFRLVADGTTLGTLPVNSPLVVGAYLIFGGRRWKIVGVDARHKVIDLIKARGGTPPRFDGGPIDVADEVRIEMARLYQSDSQPGYLDAFALALLDEGRSNFHRLALDQRQVISAGANTLVFPWIGTRALNTLALLFRSLGFDATPQDLSIEVRSTTPEETLNALVQIETGDSQDAESIAALVENKVTEKHHHYLHEELLTADYAAAHLDVAGAIGSARDIVAASHPKDDP